MAERTLMDRKVAGASGYLCIYLSIYLSIYLFIYLSTYLSIYLAIYLSIYLSIFLSFYLFICLPICPPIYLSIYLPISLSVYLSVYMSILPVYLSIYLSVFLSIYLSIYLYIYLSIYWSVYPAIMQAWKRVEKEAILRDLLEVESWKIELFLPNFLPMWKLTTSKTQHFCESSFKMDVHSAERRKFCETSSIYWIDNIKNEAILRDIVQKCKVECWADSLVPMRFAIFPLHLSKVLRLPRKSEAKSYEVLHMSRKIILANLTIWCSKTQIPTFKCAPDVGCFCAFWLRNVLRATPPCTFISHLTRRLRTRRFSEPTFRPSAP